MPALTTIQSGIKNSGNRDMTPYALFLGGLDVTNNALAQYDPLRTGYGRIFVVKKPKFIETLMRTNGGDVEKKKYNSFFHMLEYGFTSIDGIQNTTLEFEQMTGGYAGRSLDIPTLSRDETNSITIKVYEFAGSPIREMIDIWVTGIADPYTGLTHYYGLNDPLIPISQANHTAEMIYVQTDPSGNSNGIEYACMLCNMMPKTVKKDHFNHDSGSHPIVQYDIDFTATKYESNQINQVAKALVAKQTILKNYTYFQSGYDPTTVYNSATALQAAAWGTSPAARTADPGINAVLAP